MKTTAEILIVGNEILIGDILDTNSNWLCKLLHDRGGVVSRITVLPDEMEIVSSAVGEALERRPDILFTSGGLGPTADDLTLEAVAAGTGRKTVLHPEAREMVRKQYDAFFERGILTQAGLNPAREKMAWLPEGATPVFNPVGTAPASHLKVENTSIISLPGVPDELKGIIEQSLQEFLDNTLGDGTAISKSVTVRCNDESLMDPVLRRIVENYPEVYTKSLATPLGGTPEIDIIMTISGTDEKRRLLEKACLELCEGMIERGFEVRDNGEHD